LIDSKSEWFNETNAVFQQVLDQVASNLNEIHSVNYSTRYWNIFVGPWLQQFVDMVMFRIRDLANDIEIPAAIAEYDPANSLRHFHELSKLESFVERLHHDTLLHSENNKDARTTERTVTRNSMVVAANEKLGRSFVTATYVSRKTEAALQLRLGRAPRRIKHQDLPSVEINSKFRTLLSNAGENKPTKARVVIALLPRYMPRSYIEQYGELIQTRKPWGSERFPKIIFTANRHLYDDVFNFWTALATEHGSRLVLAQHGGNYGISEFPSFSERHENLVADRYVTWGWSSTGPTYKGFALPLIGRALHSSQPTGHLLVITDQLWKYPRSIFSDTPESSTYLGHLKSTIDGLLPEIRSKTLLRIHHAHEDAGSSQIDWWKLNCRDIRLNVGEVGFQKQLAESRLVLIAHNGTSVPESIALHAPTIITWSDSYMKVRQSAEHVFLSLERVGIFHRTPESVASFINSIWDDVDGWWNSPATLDARKQFTDQYARAVPNPIRFLAKALQF
jgi:putative transferase (TIGR04331 family)